jgi:hypothetical protein|tara:strand:- start:475 stop:822 length:348 start_codon:yes stop_codon:yes gene_type:complete
MAHLVTKQFDRTTIFVLSDMEASLRVVLGADAIVDLLSNLSEGWLQVSSDAWESTTDEAVQAQIDSVPVPITYETSYRQLTTNPTFVALVQWMATEHSKTVAEVDAELKAILEAL